jgi:hypothetical protein
MEELCPSATECTWSNDVRQTEMHTAASLLPQHSSFRIETATEKLETYKSAGYRSNSSRTDTSRR